MVVAAWTVHRENGFFIVKSGWEYNLVLGVAAVVAGSPEAGLAAIAGGQQAAMANILAYSQAQESTADQAGAIYLENAGTSGRGSIDFFKKLQNQEFRYAISQSTGYGRTHPLTGERIANLEERYRASPNWDRPTDPALEARFQRIKAKLTGYIEEPARTLRLYPEGDTSVPARYARAYAWHKSAYPEKALAEVRSLLAESRRRSRLIDVVPLVAGGQLRSAAFAVGMAASPSSYARVLRGR